MTRYKNWERTAIIWQMTQNQVSPNEKFLILALNEHADGDGKNCFPSRETLHQETGLKPNTITKLIRSVKDKGFIKVSARYKDGAQSSNNYQLLYQKMKHPPTPQSHPPGDSITPPLLHNHTPPVTKRVTDQIPVTRSPLPDPLSRMESEDGFEEWLRAKLENDPNVRSVDAVTAHVLKKGKSSPEYREYEDRNKSDSLVDEVMEDILCLT